MASDLEYEKERGCCREEEAKDQCSSDQSAERSNAVHHDTRTIDTDNKAIIRLD